MSPDVRGELRKSDPRNSDFARRLIRWHERHGRHDLPWQNTTDPYRVWLSEIMLQQTQVATALPYYQRFLERFPTLADLAVAPVDEVMALWSGLGYYARARNLHACAQLVMSDHAGSLPRSPEALLALPGIGRSTANSIATFCFGARAPILDGNVKRVLCRAFGIEGYPGQAAVEKRLWLLATELMPNSDGGVYNQAQMDLGALVCTRSTPRCKQCPVAESCVALRSKRLADFPTARPRKLIPERSVTLLVITDAAGALLLETRPPAGIWGGMQSLPELPEGERLDQWLQRVLGASAVPHSGDAVSPAPTLRHAFSHFRLTITPLRCTIERPQVLAEPGRQWLNPTQAAAAALPAPVRKILQRMQYLVMEDT